MLRRGDEGNGSVRNLTRRVLAPAVQVARRCQRERVRRAAEHLLDGFERVWKRSEVKRRVEELETVLKNAARPGAVDVSGLAEEQCVVIA